MEPEGNVATPASLDPENLGFMCGIEVHQQLATGKLHSRQPGELHDVTIDTNTKFHLQRKASTFFPNFILILGKKSFTTTLFAPK